MVVFAVVCIFCLFDVNTHHQDHTQLKLIVIHADEMCSNDDEENDYDIVVLCAHKTFQIRCSSFASRNVHPEFLQSTQRHNTFRHIQ